MPLYSYEGRGRSGEKMTGTLEANNPDDVVRYLEDRAIIPINIALAANKKNFFVELFQRSSVVRAPEVLDFARQMTTMISAGVPVIRAVGQLAKSTASKTFREILFKVVEDVESGKTLAAALHEHPKVFSSVFASLVEVGENTGHLDDTFLRLSGYLESQLNNKRRLVATIRYPLIVISAVLIVVVVMNIFVIPKFSALFTRFKAKLPLPTRILIAFSNFMTQHWGICLIGLVVLIVAIRLALTLPKIRLFWDRAKLKLPVIGNIQQRILIAQFVWTFGMILRSGVPVLRGMQLMATVSSNKYVGEKILEMRAAIDRGENFSRAAQLSGLFNASAVQMLEVGDETGKLDDMLAKVALSYENDIDYDIKNLGDLLEPILLAFVGGLVLLLALAIYLPMWEMVQLVR